MTKPFEFFVFRSNGLGQLRLENFSVILGFLGQVGLNLQEITGLFYIMKEITRKFLGQTIFAKQMLLKTLHGGILVSTGCYIIVSQIQNSCYLQETPTLGSGP